MTQPCSQEGKIARVETTLDNVVSLLERHEEREERVLDFMEKVASQTETIKAHAASIERHDKALDEAFELLREKRNFTMTLLESSAGNILLGMIVAGFLIDITVHFEVVKQIYNIVKAIK